MEDIVQNIHSPIPRKCTTCEKSHFAYIFKQKQNQI